MPGGGDSSAARLIVYCVVPRDLSAKLHEPLRAHFAESDVAVVVEQRQQDRRIRAERRTATAVPATDRRVIRSEAGRRVADRRALAVPAPTTPPLPRKARRYADRLVFVERLEPSQQQRRDADSKRLVTRYQAGDHSAFEELYLRYFNPVYSYAKVALGDHHEAEDVTQQVFVRVMLSLRRYELRSNVPFRGWLFSVARNVMIDALRGRHGLLPEPPEQLDVLREHGPEPADPDVADKLSWLSDREIAMFVERLPLSQRQVLVLRFMLDLSGEETAQVLGRSHISVRQLQVRALATLQRQLTAVGRAAPRRGRTPMKARIKPGTVIVRRRFALGIKPPKTAR